MICCLQGSSWAFWQRQGLGLPDWGLWLCELRKNPAVVVRASAQGHLTLRAEKAPNLAGWTLEEACRPCCALWVHDLGQLT